MYEQKPLVCQQILTQAKLRLKVPRRQHCVLTPWRGEVLITDGSGAKYWGRPNVTRVPMSKILGGLCDKGGEN